MKKLYKSFFFNSKLSKGFSLTEVTVGMSLLMVVAMGGLSVGKMLDHSSDAGIRAQQTLGMASQIRETFKYARTCSTALASGGINQSINPADLLAGNQSVVISAPHVGAGDGDDLIQTGEIFAQYNLRIQDLRFVNAFEIQSGSNRYFALIRIAFVNINGGVPQKPIILGAVEFELSGSSASESIVRCNGVNADVTQLICEDMGCEWTTSPDRCLCRSVNSICPVGEYAVEFLPSGPVCQRLGTASACPAGQYLKSIGLNSQNCQPLPTPAAAATPTPTPSGATPTPSPAGATPTPTPAAGAFSSCNELMQDVSERTRVRTFHRPLATGPSGNYDSAPMEAYVEGAPSSDPLRYNNYVWTETTSGAWIPTGTVCKASYTTMPGWLIDCEIKVDSSYNIVGMNFSTDYYCRNVN